ncbi:class I SAM-dependent methyltransferase [Chlorogloeopsis sp. ULAP01]|uniref:class I SAM-dependent methyltransferase n=1 Tax=Chlorogloeopsis sp. ULAP01 TaxID=3056483 RepID=UPI0025AB46B7|nr:class I SAM-dependent methyltransferase [Chlorogloeopsis sp. ULAP01]MDM9379666.1 class I SAM-dependent methyltransferase [Chlorogloeopsis sp. ULAP01]
MGSAEIQGVLWGAAAGDWANYQEATSVPLWHDVLYAARAGEGMKILDAGCGAGGACIEAAKLGCEVTGVDASASLLAIARQRLPQARFEQADLESLPFRNEEFDGAIAVNSVMYATDMQQAIKELARVTRLHKRVAIASWGKPEDCEMRDVFSGIISILPSKPSGGGPFVLSAPGVLAALIESSGLRFVEQGETRCDFSYPNIDICWRALSSAGSLQAAMNAVGEAAVREKVEDTARKYTDSSGAITFRNTFIWVVGERV